MIHRIYCWLVLLTLPGLVVAQATLPTLPQTYVDTTYSAPTGATCTAANSAAFQTCLNNAALNSTIVLQAGTTYSGAFSLPNKTSGSGWIYIVSSNLENLPGEGERISPSDVSNMPKISITYAGGNQENAIRTLTNAHHYRFVGIEITSTNFVYEMVALHYPSHHIIFDRCYVHAPVAAGSRRGFRFNAYNSAIINSDVREFKDATSDSQALFAHQNPGPILIENNFLSASGEVINWGGSDNNSADEIPQDITIKRNHFYWNPDWEKSAWIEKNLLESKMSKRVLVEGNLFENHWIADSGQNYAVVLKSENQEGTNPWAETAHWTIRKNKFIGMKGMLLNTYHASGEQGGIGTPANNILFEDNLVFMDGGDRFLLAVYIDHLGFNHNTIINNGESIALIYKDQPSEDFRLTNNIVANGDYSIFCPSGPFGKACLDITYPSSYIASNNAIVGGSSGQWTGTTNYFPTNYSSVGFVNYTGSDTGNYRLSASSPYKNAGTDGKDLGADIDALEAAMDGLPTLPQTFDTTYSAPTGGTCTAANSSAFQTCLNNAALNSTIVLQAGTTYTGPFTLPNKTSGSGWIYIVSSNLANLPAAGTRVSSSHATNMPKIVATAGGENTIKTATAAHHYRFVGIEFAPVSGNFLYNNIQIGNNESTISNLPSDIIFDRCYIHGDPSLGGRRGVAMNGKRIAVIDSHVSGFKEVGAHTQALWTYNTPGPLKISNNYLEAAGENVATCGAVPSLVGVNPSDIEITRNHFFKPLEWIGSSYEIRHLLEFKCGVRVLIEGNLFENNFSTSLPYAYTILITPRSEGTQATWLKTTDITIRNNKLVNVGDGIGLSGHDGDGDTTRSFRIAITNNVIQTTGVGGHLGVCLMVIQNTSDVLVDHNTMFCPYETAVSSKDSSFNGVHDNFEMKNNIAQRGQYGFYTGYGEGTMGLNAVFGSTWIFIKNAIWGNSGVSSSYPANNYFPANATAVGFVDYAGGNYRLSASSPYKYAGTDGKDLGADIDALEAAMAGDGGDTTSPTTTISISDPSAISTDGLTVIGTASDDTAVSGCKWRIGAAPDGSNGTACAGTTSFSCATSGYASGANTLYVGCYDAAGNYGSDSITVNYTDVILASPSNLRILN